MRDDKRRRFETLWFLLACAAAGVYVSRITEGRPWWEAILVVAGSAALAGMAWRLVRDFALKRRS